MSVRGSFGGFLHAELSSSGSSELRAEVISQSWRQHEKPRRVPVDFLFWEELLIRWFAVETSTFMWCCTRAGIVEELKFADGEWDSWLVSTSTVAVRTQVARVGHRATRDVR